MNRFEWHLPIPSTTIASQMSILKGAPNLQTLQGKSHTKLQKFVANRTWLKSPFTLEIALRAQTQFSSFVT